MRITKEMALEYHSRGKPGKIQIEVTKPCETQLDLSLAYTPGVAEPVREIHKNPDLAYKYTLKGNLVAVISNGTAVLGLGDVGALAGKPVMEGKAVLFKRFADIDAIDIDIDEKDPDKLIEIIKSLEPTFGGINLEDIKAPECFYIEEKLKELMDIPVFHDDQHGTAIISGAGLLNALELQKKKIDEIIVVINGAGASAIATAKFYVLLGVKKENIIMCDSKGVIYKGRKEGMNPYKEEWAIETDKRTLAEALEGADVFIGLSVGNVVTKEMIKKMASRPIIFAMANPDPEIPYEEAKAARPDAIIATGRSDYPNQINNVLGFPFIFRGALDVGAKKINDEMKLAACYALRDLAKEEVPDAILKAYGLDSLKFGPDYIVPKPLDPRVLLWEAPAVAKAAIESGVARYQIDIEEYREKLEAKLGKSREIMRIIINKAKKDPKRVVYSEGEVPRIVKASYLVHEEGIAKPILIGRDEVIRKIIDDLGLDYDPEIVYPETHPKFNIYVREFYELRKRKGLTYSEAVNLMKIPNYFGPMMVYMGDADAYVAGLTYNYPDVLRPALQIIKPKSGVSKVAGLYIMVLKDKVYFFSDATVNIEPTSEDLADIAILAADFAKKFDIKPKVAMLSFSNFGSVRHPLSDKVRKAVEIVRAKRPDIQIDGEMQADTAVVPEIIENLYPFSRVKDANVLIFPDLEAANVAYKLLQRLGGAEAIGPILMGASKSIHVLQTGDEEKDIVNITAVAVVDAQELV